MSLGPDEGAILSRAREGLRPTAEDRARLRAAIGSGIAATLAPGSVATATWLGKWSVVVKGAGIAVVVVGAAGAARWVVTDRSTTARASSSNVSAATPAGSPGEGTDASEREVGATFEPVRVGLAAPPHEVSAPSAPSATATATASGPAPSVAPRRGPARKLPVMEPSRAVAASPREGGLGEEAALVSDASAARRLGDPARALVLLAEHAQRFPQGVLSEERDAERVQALCAAGRTDEGRAEAARFVRDRPGSALVTKVENACAEKKK